MRAGEFLKSLREKKESSLRRVSIRAGVSHTQISDLEKGVNLGTKEKNLKVLKAVDATEEDIEYFFLLQDYEKTPERIITELKKYKKISEYKSSQFIENLEEVTQLDIELGKELLSLTNSDKEKVLIFIQKILKHNTV